jgi:uncharacterized protein (DUF2062 family)
MRRFQRFLPSPATLKANRWLRWLGPALHHPSLWHVTRRGVAMGMALGVFFGLLIPVAQIPFSAATAMLLRANVPAAVASTLVTNPVTFGPVYYAAWRLGSAVLGEDAPEGDVPPLAQQPGAAPAEAGWWNTLKGYALGVGKPLVLGLAILATVLGLLTYFSVAGFWALKIRWTRWRRLRFGIAPSASRPS